ncbi:MAG TPA: hypothetical protein DDY17_02330 [Syntrophaceae bacterium]|jgi:hypothetical protein|nr:hypothetical protein [Syntrophaceae bacterium]
MFLGKRDRQGRRDPFPFFPNDNPMKIDIMQKRKEEDERRRQRGSGETDRALRVSLPGTQKKTLLGE